MKNLYIDNEAAAPELAPQGAAGLAERVYSSRLYGREPRLVLHGGGNTSVKARAIDLFGDEVEVLYMKGSGADLGKIRAGDFVCLELAPLRKLRTLADLADDEMENQLETAKFRTHPRSPSVETLVHAFLPHRFVDHTHADAILALTNRDCGAALTVEVLGPDVIVMPYARPGFPLAKSLIEAFDRWPDATAVVVEGHGIFTFADEAKMAYDLMIEFTSRAEAWLADKAVKHAAVAVSPISNHDAARLVQAIRGACALPRLDGGLRRFLIDLRTSADLVRDASRPEAALICASGVLTPDHAIRTRNAWLHLECVPESDADLRASIQEKLVDFADEYRARLDKWSGGDALPADTDLLPRVILVEGLGLAALGITRRDARIAADVAEQTLRTKLLAMDSGGYEPIADRHVFEMEFWGPQRKKLGRAADRPLEGQAALVTGGAGAIALGIADELIQAGAAVMLADLDEKRLARVRDMLIERHGPDAVEITTFDVTDYEAVARAVDHASTVFGGLDLIVPNAGVAHVANLEDLDPAKFDQVLAVNLKGVFHLIKAAIPVFRRQNTGGNVVVVSSKNVFDPGASFGAYSASKAGAHQIGKIAALELAEIGVRVNMINPDAVFGEGEITSKLWDTVGPDRMRCRGLDPSCMQDYYCQRNLLKAKVTARHVGAAVVFFAADSTPTTGATLPIDGGVPGAFPR